MWTSTPQNEVALGSQPAVLALLPAALASTRVSVRPARVRAPRVYYRSGTCPASDFTDKWRLEAGVNGG